MIRAPEGTVFLSVSCTLSLSQSYLGCGFDGCGIFVREESATWGVNPLTMHYMTVTLDAGDMCSSISFRTNLIFS